MMEHKFNVGDEVMVLPLAEYAKEHYPAGWNPQMDEHIGQTGKITRFTTKGYKISGLGRWTWCDTNLELAVKYVPY